MAPAAKSMLDLLGIESTEKRIIMTVANSEKTQQFIKDMRQQLYIGIPGHGIVIAIPIKSVGGGKTLAYLNNGEQQPARYTPELNGKYELIVIVANEGRTDQVMNAAARPAPLAALCCTAKAPAARIQKSSIMYPSLRKRK